MLNEFLLFPNTYYINIYYIECNDGHRKMGVLFVL